MINTLIIGASGYTGAELVRLVSAHPQLNLSGLYVSANSADAGRAFSQLYPEYQGITGLTLQPLPADGLARLAQQHDVIFLATPHALSHQIIQPLFGQGALLVDLSGAFRLQQTELYPAHYGFAHQHPDLLQQAVYGLTDWYAGQIKQARLLAVPGCYPTASLLALKPLAEQGLLAGELPVINAVSGVSGAGRKASLNNSFCQVSLQAYGVHTHRHQPEIAEFLGQDVVFTPHLGNFTRGILATITVKVAKGVTQAQIDQAYQNAYAQQPLIRFSEQFPTIAQVAGQPFCDLHWQLNASNRHLVIGSAIDNLLKGAASQAMECANLALGLPQLAGIGSLHNISNHSPASGGSL